MKWPSLKAKNEWFIILFVTSFLQDAIKVRFKKITPIPDIAHIEALCSLLESLVVPANIPSDAPKETYEVPISPIISQSHYIKKLCCFITENIISEFTKLSSFSESFL